jgi:hypothetical protein
MRSPIILQLNEIGVTMDEYQTNIVARFLTTGALPRV